MISSHNSRATVWGKFWALVVVLLVASSPLGAHNGPPFPIISDKRVGPAVVSLWTHPDVGTGLFYVIVEPPGGAIPPDLKIEIGVRPVTGRLPEVMYPMKLENLRGQVVYRTDAQFDQQELWHVRMIVKSSAGDGEASADVEVTSPGVGGWGLLLFLLPFLGVGFLWFRVMMRKRQYRKSQLQKVSG